jgi:hypothetical protein
MNIEQLNGIFEVIPTFSASTINTFQSGKDYEFPSNGDNIYPLLYLEEDYLFTIDNNRENWTIALLVLDYLDMDNLKITKNNLRDELLTESRNVVEYFKSKLKEIEFQGTISNVSFLSLLDFETDNLQGWRIEINFTVVNSSNRCNIYE